MSFTLLPSEVRLLTEDFGDAMSVGETIVDELVTASVYSGTDATPSDRISGAATSDGTVVSQQVEAPAVAGNIYSLLFTCTTSAGQYLKRTRLLTIRPAA